MLSLQDLPIYDGDTSKEFRSSSDWISVVETIFKIYKVRADGGRLLWVQLDKSYWTAYAVTRLRGDKLKEWESKNLDPFAVHWDGFCRDLKT